MSHISSVSSYPYRGTLSRLDANGDGMLSQAELEAANKPGMLSVDSAGGPDDGLDSSTSALGSFVAKLLQIPSTAASSGSSINLTQTTGAASKDTPSANDLYQATYGQFAMEDMAA